MNIQPLAAAIGGEIATTAMVCVPARATDDIREPRLPAGIERLAQLRLLRLVTRPT